jgi:flagellar basal-body rod protein FlgG
MTGNEFDVAIKGLGYFQVLLPSGETGYTRDGSFQLDQNGQMVTSEGYAVQPSITVPTDAVDVTINASGEVLVKLQNQTALANVGQLQLATFANDAGLEAIGNNLLLETEASGSAVVNNPGEPGYGAIEQGALETSNVNIVQEITSLIQAQRAYEMNSKIIQTGDEMLSTISQLR